MSTGQGSAVIWIYELQQRTLRPLTDVGGTGAFWPVWSEDGQSVVFSAFGAGGRTHVFRVGVEGNAAPDLLLGGDRDAQPYSWLPDGAALAFQQEGDADSGWDVWLLPLTGDSTPTPLIKGSANETHPAFSPDGRWLAYASDETGRYEVYVRRYPELDRPRRVSASGGMGPVWRGDGSELFYHTGSFQDPAGTAFMTVPFDDGPGEPRQIAWFNGIHGVGLPYGRGFDVTPDGQRLLVSVNEQEISLFLPNLEIVINWFDELALKFRK